MFLYEEKEICENKSEILQGKKKKKIFCCPKKKKKHDCVALAIQQLKILNRI